MWTVLIVDDERVPSGTLQDTLTKEGFNPFRAESYDEGQKLLQQREYDICMIDIALSFIQRGDQVQPVSSGLRLCEDARRKSADTLIIVYSMFIDKGREQDSEYYAQAIDAGADFVVARSWVDGITGSKLAEFLRREVNAKRRAALARRPLYLTDHWRSKALKEEVGEDVLAKIIHRAVPAGDNDTVSVFTGGYSGAAVLNVNTSRRSEGREDQELVVKISRDPDPLSTELRSAPALGSPLEFGVARPMGDGTPVDGWYWIVAPTVRKSVNLRDVLLGAKEDAVADHIAQRIAEQYIYRPAMAATTDIDRSSELQNTKLSFRLVSQVHDALKWIRDLDEILTIADIDSINTLSEFLERGVGLEWSFGRNAVGFAYQHGDLHCENILLDIHNNPVLIDFGLSRRLPRFSDAANIIVDVWFRALDGTGARAHDWSRVDEWAAQVNAQTSQFPDVALASVSTPRWERFISLILMTLQQVDPPPTRAEFSDALFFHLLRYIRFNTLPPPKRLLALRLAIQFLPTV